MSKMDWKKRSFILGGTLLFVIFVFGTMTILEILDTGVTKDDCIKSCMDENKYFYDWIHKDGTTICICADQNEGVANRMVSKVIVEEIPFGYYGYK